MEKNDQKDDKAPTITLADLEARDRQAEARNIRIRSGLRAGLSNGKYANPGKY